MTPTKFLNDIMSLTKKHEGKGLSIESIYGALEAAKFKIGLQIEMNYKNQLSLERWEETKKFHGKELAKSEAVIVTEDN